MARTALAVRLIPLPDPVTANVNEPVGESLGIVTVSVEEKSAEPVGVLKTPLTPDGNPSTVKETWESKPFDPATCTE